MQVQVRASNGLYWVVNAAGGIAATGARDVATTFELTGFANQVCILQGVPSGRYVSAVGGGGGAVSGALQSPSLEGSAFTAVGGAPVWDQSVALRAADGVHFLTVDLRAGDAIVATATSPGPRERFTLDRPPIPIDAPTLQGSHSVGAAVTGGSALLLATGWRRCRRCAVLYDGAAPRARAACSAAVVGRPIAVRAGLPRAASHLADGDAAYGVLSAEDRSASALLAFRRCNACAAMVIAGVASGACAANGGAHNYAGSTLYAPIADLAYDPQRAPRRWYVCAKCTCLFCDPAGAAPCVAGGVHDAGDSLPYMVRSP